MRKLHLLTVAALAIIISGCAGSANNTASDHSAQEPADGKTEKSAPAKSNTVNWDKPEKAVNSQGETICQWTYNYDGDRLISCQRHGFAPFEIVLGRNNYVDEDQVCYFNEHGDICKTVTGPAKETEEFCCTYGGNGKLLKKGVTEYQYDDEGRISQEVMDGDYVLCVYDYYDSESPVKINLPVGVKRLDSLGRLQYICLDDSYSANYSYSGNCMTVAYDPYCEPDEDGNVDPNCHEETFKVFFLER